MNTNDLKKHGYAHYDILRNSKSKRDSRILTEDLRNMTESSQENDSIKKLNDKNYNGVSSIIINPYGKHQHCNLQ